MLAAQRVLALAVLLLAVCSQVLADSGAPKFSGTFDGTSATVDASVTHSGSDGVTTELVNKFSYPTSAKSWAGFANENNIDLIAMSTHGRSGISRWALGSVTDKVLQSSQKPILLVRAQETKD